MKARIKATGEIVEVIAVGDYINELGQIIGEYKDANGRLCTSYELDFYIEEGIAIPDYWTRLEHQYAGMAMQGVLASADLLFSLCKNRGDCPVKVVAIEFANDCAHALVEKLKKKEEK